MSRLRVCAAVLVGFFCTTLCIAQTTTTTGAGRTRVVFQAPPPAASVSAKREPPQGPARISGFVMAGQLKHKVVPEYPLAARQNHVVGTVVLHILIAKDGNVKNVAVVTGPKLLQAAAVNAVKQWQYAPYKLNGSPVQVDTTVLVNF